VRRRIAVALAVLVVVLADLGLAGCVSLPDQGPVRSRTVADTGENETLVDYTPAGPHPGSSRRVLVEDFLTSMRATPTTTHVAREYLTTGRSGRWAPERGTVVYGSQQLLPGPGGRLTLRLRDVVELDGRGDWLGDPTHGRGHDYLLRLVRHGGQWRIADLPDRLLVPRTHFDSQYQQYSLYFFDPSGQVLVPEPVYVPRGDQATTLLLSGLLQGPAADHSRVERTYFPHGTALDGISAPVSLSGTAEVPLNDEVLVADDARLQRMFAQLAWTLCQVSTVERVSLTAAGAPVDPPGTPVGTVDTGDTSKFDPALAWASSALFGVRDRHVVTNEDGREDRLSGVFGALPLAPRTIAVDGLAQHVAGVTADGARLLVADRDGTPDRTAQPSDARTVLQGTDLLRPVYDLHGHLWVLDRTSAGARLTVVQGSTPRSLTVPGITGADVRHLLVSRDGSRLVAERRDGGRDELVTARIERDASGRVTGIGTARLLEVEGAPDRIVDVAWRTPVALAVLVAPSSDTSEVLFAKIDGSSTATELSRDAALFRGRATGLVTSPSRGSPLTLTTSAGRLHTLTGRGQWTTSSVSPGLMAATYVD
jgi:hypothetical protein